jgi:hypothetical protein
VDEDRLTPQMGRLIDAAKAAAGAGGGAARGGATAVALLGADAEVYVGRGECGAAAAQAAAAALASAGRSGEAGPAAAAFALAEGLPSAVPDPGCLRVLAAVDPGLPVVFKDRGRWIVLPASQIEGAP